MINIHHVINIYLQNKYLLRDEHGKIIKLNPKNMNNQKRRLASSNLLPNLIRLTFDIDNIIHIDEILIKSSGILKNDTIITTSSSNIQLNPLDYE